MPHSTASTTLANSTSVLGDPGFDQFAPSGLKTCQCTSLVLRHETAVANDVGRQNCCKLTLPQRALHAPDYPRHIVFCPATVRWGTSSRISSGPNSMSG